MEIKSKYNPAETEDKWYSYWMEQGFFKSVPDEREPYTIVIPPPNVTGVLHMGHMLNNTIQDILVRRARMLGKNACWVPGTDHASIATEAKVVEKLKADGIEKQSLSRDEFLKYAWEWKEKHGGIILEQLKKLGASCDWDRTCFTMDEIRSKSVIKVFVDLYNKGLIYRGIRMVNWDPKAKTAISDEEVNHKEIKSNLYHIRYLIENSDNQYVTIATTRPETILGDTAVCVNPNDERFHYLKGKRALVPLINRSVPIIEDEYVDMEFGTGCLKITPAHDINDYEIGIRHNLETIDILNDDGTLNENAIIFIGEDRFVVRKKIVEKLKEAGNLVKIEDYDNKVGFSERTDVPIEPKLSLQWFLKMKELAKPALDAVMNDEIKFHPAKYKNLYKHWMENVKDWNISRQLWWGHRIPVWYTSPSLGGLGGAFVVANSSLEALELARQQTGNNSLVLSDLKQDEDVLDTWASSWIWPLSVFDGLNHENKEIDYYYPTNDLVTAPEIIFFWVARMIMAGYEFRNTYPFKNVYFTGIVRDKLRRKMSKSLGNSPDPLDLIAKYGADGVRVGMLLCSPAGNDILFDESLTEQGRNFANKIWNAFRLVKTWQVDNSIPQPESSKIAVKWFENKLQQEMQILNNHFDKYRISDALMAVYNLFWDEFSSWYLEIIKPDYQQPIDEQTYNSTLCFFDDLIHLLHPFMPFITEEIWHQLKERKKGESLMIEPLPQLNSFSENMLQQIEKIKEVIVNIRTIRKNQNISFKEKLELAVLAGEDGYYPLFNPLLEKMGMLSNINEVSQKVENTSSFFIKSSEFFLMVNANINVDEEITKLEKEIIRLEKFLDSVLFKLNNPKFLANAPESLLELENRKKTDTESKIKALKESIDGLRGKC